jgi:hypothetical protein
MEASSIALGVLGTAVAGLLGYSYIKRQQVGELKDYKDEVCRNLYGQHKIFSERELDRELRKYILSSTQKEEHQRLEDCRRIIFPRKWFGGKKTRKVRKDTFMSRRR